MKQLYFIILLISILFNLSECCAQTSKTILEIEESSIPLSEIQSANFSDNDKIENFIFKTILSKPQVKNNVKLNLWTTSADLVGLEESGIIFVRHDYDLKRLNNTDQAITQKRVNLQTEVQAYREAIETAKLAITKLSFGTLSQTDFTTLTSNTLLFPQEEHDALNGYVINRATAVQQSNLLQLLKEKITLIQVQLAKKQTEFDDNTEAIVEGKSIITTILHKEKGEWSNYLLDTRKILLVLLGGDEDIAKFTVNIVNEKTEFEVSFNDLRDLAKALNIPLGGSQSLKCKIIQLNPNAIKAPSNIILRESSIKDSIHVKIHESGRFSFKVGVSGTLIEKNNFVIENQELQITLDEDAKKEWQENLIVMLEGSFTKRDFDRFGSIFDSKSKTQFWDRWGFFVGCKLSTKPWDLLTGGLSFSLSRYISLNVGLSLNLIEKEQTIEIGDITSLDDAKELADLEYSDPKLFLGISFSPKIITKALGLGK